jgi:hypothetical protein
MQIKPFLEKGAIVINHAEIKISKIKPFFLMLSGESPCCAIIKHFFIMGHT